MREQSRGCRHSPEHRSNRDRARSPPAREASGYEPRMRDRSPRRGLHPIGDTRSPSVVEVERRHGTPIKVSGTAARLATPSFSTPFCPEIVNAPRCGKVKMSMVDLYDGTGDPEEHLGVYKAQMYVQDVDDASYCRYFPPTLKGVAQSWFNGLPQGSVACF